MCVLLEVVPSGKIRMGGYLVLFTRSLTLFWKAWKDDSFADSVVAVVVATADDDEEDGEEDKEEEDGEEEEEEESSREGWLGEYEGYELGDAGRKTGVAASERSKGSFNCSSDDEDGGEEEDDNDDDDEVDAWIRCTANADAK